MKNKKSKEFWLRAVYLGTSTRDLADAQLGTGSYVPEFINLKDLKNNEENL